MNSGETPKLVIQKRDPIGREQIYLWRICDCQGYKDVCEDCQGAGGFYEKIKTPFWKASTKTFDETNPFE